MRILLIRHGQTSYNLEYRIMGWLGITLNEIGKEQISKLAYFLKDNFDIKKIFSSDLERCKESCSIISSILNNNDIEYIANLREHNFGSWEGFLYEELKLRTEFNEFLEFSDPNMVPPLGESINSFERRVKEGFEYILSKEENLGQDILIVAHGGTNRIILGNIFGLSFFESQKIIKQSNACLNVLQYDKENNRIAIDAMNITTYLF